jgi:hypothetical protein
MDPDGTPKGSGFQKTHPLDQCLSEPFLKEASDQEVRRGEDEKKGEESIIDEIDHYLKTEIRISGEASVSDQLETSAYWQAEIQNLDFEILSKKKIQTKKVVIARTPHLMRGTQQSHEIASLRPEHDVVQGFVRNDNLWVSVICISNIRACFGFDASKFDIINSGNLTT